MAVILSRVSRLPRTLGLPASFETHVDGFWIDKTDVTNQEFERFVRATGYAKVAERKPRAEDFPGAQPEDLVAGAVVFSPPFGNTSKEVSRPRTPRDCS
jgi:formylglycine-generating enzyme required for sulfatase activity